ncbi:MAG: Integral rane protein TerC family [Devosia sp.]|uniref:TerC family protein n=1 Tax=Devosia sp. TaxID=1871048 RepID=UPI00260C6858|nr:TerC family protein [Devosia sp.]MDB5529377.1 Integral rane protein TerC family [Devosia sp.]
MLFDATALSAYLEIITINIVLSGDNVVVIGMAAATLAPELRAKAILAGIAAATVIRIGFALLATQLLAIPGLQLVGGLLLLWVCWKMYEELRAQDRADHPTADEIAHLPRKTLRQAVTQIIVADVSMSLDNVLAVAGAAKHNITALVFGLVLSVVLMGVAASLLARILDRYRWIAWIGLLIIVYVAVTMLYEGADQLMGHTLPNIPLLKG